jgi:hypothetical protein
MKQYWIVAFGRPWEDESFIGITVPQPLGRGPDGERLYSDERALCLFDSEEAARGFWQEIREFDVDDHPEVQDKELNIVPVKPEGLEELVRRSGHPLVVVNPSVLLTQERYFWSTEEFLDSL